ncbi:hypothetical protein AAG570_008610 [Ranatra chinensis]|uniref:Insulin-like domain-containing protein n=1 Tax=Ranatra chinensis TaxID=642074 RepID=A0ABD0Z4A4_9HEMI
MVVGAYLLMAAVAFLLPDSGSGRRLCGNDLAEVLAQVCDGQFYEGEKKSDPGAVLNEIPIDDAYSRFPFFPKRYAYSMAAGSLDKRGQIPECCRRSCRYNELTKHCG